ncbi:BQ00720 family protein [Mesorhizobium sp. A623]
MTRTQENTAMTKGEFALLGEGSVAYLRKVSSDDLRGRFPTLGEIAPGMELWALFSANGQPILLSDARDRALAGAMENDLVTVAIH